ncbi:MAG: sigma-70 family RNA polymerase sigma factor [Gemmataceae bacterium]|nr:sigma-70 family RNA polymerase sigma factor [Gemmataceae bacterium]MCI0739752.1 sigma-70 family RNA polymerase sigma factor [Gemmataceae bacterium]
MTAPEENAATSTSRSLLARVHANDAAAWDRLVTLYAPLVWHWCRKMSLRPEDSADVFQEVFQAVATHIGSFRKEGPQDTFRGWLRTITKNKILDHFRAEKRQPQAAGGTDAQVRWAQIPENDWDGDAADENAIYKQIYHRALELIQTDFEERTWRAFWRVVVDGCTPQEVGQELSLSPGAVRVAKCRVLHRLRQELGDLIG